MKTHLFLLLLIAGNAAAQTVVPPEPRLLTSSPAADYAPDVSPDGRYVVFTSERSGNPDIYYLEYKETGTTEPPRQITNHPAIDKQGRLSADGKWLAFESYREDALGDIWVMKFPRSTARPITEPGVQDRAPQFLRGGGMVVYESAPIGEDFQWRSHSLEGNRTIDGPAPDPMQNQPAPPAPIHDVRPREGVALLFADDTNRDGTLGPGDYPSAWRVVRGDWRQITYPIPGARGISSLPGRSSVVVAAVWGGNLDLAVIHDHPLQSAQSYDELMASGDVARNDWPTQPDWQIAFYRSAATDAQTSSERAVAAISLARAQYDASRYYQASQTAEKYLVGRLPSEQRYLLELELQRANFARAWFGDQPRRQRVVAAQLAASEITDLIGRMEKLGSRLAAMRGRLELAHINYYLEDYATALDLTTQLLNTGAPVRYTHREETLLLRSRIFQKQNLPTQMEEPLIEIFRSATAKPLVEDKASAELLTTIRGTGSNEDQLRRLREFGARVRDLPRLLAATKIEEANLLESMDRTDEAIRALAEAAARVEDAPRGAARAAYELSRLQAAAGKYAAAVETWTRIEAGLRDNLFPEAPRFLNDTRAQLVRYYLEKGRRELRLGDPLLANATFDELLEYDANLVEGWRGKLQAMSNVEGMMERTVEEFRRATAESPESSLEWYKLGLAYSYLNATSRDTEKALRKAIAINGTEPFYHQTLGFLMEQRWRDGVAKGLRSQEVLTSALEEYELALSLLRPANSPQARADLLLNLGNVSHELEQYSRAVGYYRERELTNTSFAEVRTELLYHYYYGISSFRSSEPARAAVHFVTAQRLLPEVNNRNLITDEQAHALRTELMGREALARMDAGDERAAVALFDEVYDLEAPDSMGRVRAQRNRAILLERLAARSVGVEKFQTLREAELSALQALALLEEPNLKPDTTGAERGGLFGYEMILSSDKVEGGAKLVFDKQDEERLVRATLARIAEQFGNREQAMLQLDRLLALDPPLDDYNRAYVLAMKAVTLVRLANIETEGGYYTNAYANLEKALAASRFEIEGEVFINTNAATIALGEIAEVIARWPETATPVAAANWWMLAGTPPSSPWQLLDIAAGSLLEMESELEPGEPLITRPVETARLNLIRSIANERLFYDAITNRDVEGVEFLEQMSTAAGYFVQARRASERVDQAAFEGSEARELNRLALIAQSVAIRLEALMESDELSALLSNSRAFAQRTGQQHLSWWVEAQPALMQPGSPTSRAAAARALDSLLALAPGALPLDEEVAWPVLDRLEGIHLAQLAHTEQHDALWDASDRWRVARLRMLFDDDTPPAAGDEDRDWQNQFFALRSQNRAALAALRSIPLSQETRRNLAQTELDRPSSQLAELIGNGHESALPSPLSLVPEPMQLADADVLLQAADMLGEEPAFLLSRAVGDFTGAYLFTSQRTEQLAADDVAKLRGLIFMMGEGTAPSDANVIRVLTTENLNTQIDAAAFDVATDVLAFPSDAEVAAGNVTIPTAKLRTASQVALGRPLELTGDTPSAWRIGDTNVLFGEVMPSLRTVRRLSTATTIPPEFLPWEAELYRLALAGTAAQLGAYRAEINGDAWLSIALDPHSAPDMAANYLDEVRGRAIDSLQKQQTEQSIIPLETIVALKEALSIDDELALNWQALATQRGKLGRWKEAAHATDKRLAVMRSQQASDSELARALRTKGDYSSRARQWPEAYDAYTESEALQRKVGNDTELLQTLWEHATAFQNAGEYHESLQMLEEVEALAKRLGDNRRVVDSLISSGRVLRRYLNFYYQAEELLRRAVRVAENVGDPALVAEAKLDLARTLEKTAEFAEALDFIDEAEVLANQAGNESLIAEASLERANVHWLRSEYYDALDHQGDALTRAQASGATPVVIAARNVQGLTYWSLNDYDQALASLNEALTLAQAEDITYEIATARNNTGVVLRAREDFQGALEQFNASLAIDEEQENRWGIAHSLRNIGITLRLQGKADQAREPLLRALDLTTEIGDRVNRAKTLLALGDVESLLGELKSAEQRYQAALEEARSIPVPEVEWRAMFGLGEVLRMRGNPGGAIRNLEGASEVVDTLRSSLRVAQLQDGFLRDKQELYDALVGLQVEEEQLVAALETSERSRGRQFIDLLGNRPIIPVSSEGGKQLQEAEEMRQEIQSLERQLSGVPEGGSRLALYDKLEAARKTYENRLAEMRRANPELTDFVSVSPVRVSELQALLDESTRLIEYHLLPNETAIWVIGPGSVELVRSPIRRQDVESMVTEARRSLQEFGDVSSQLDELGRWLITPILPALEGVTQVGIVPHGELHRLPFAALTAGNGALIDRFAIFNTPSASVLKYTVGRRRPGRTLERVLAFGNPDLQDKALELPFAEKEAKRMRFQFPAAMIRTGGEAQESWFEQNVGEYDLVHLASHGEYKPQTPMYSGLLFSPDKVSDGVLTADEVYGMKVGADLIVLSACQSGIGSIATGDDIVGLNRSFIYAGTRQLISTLWRVDDISTAILFKYFYREIDGSSRAEALRQAQLRLRAQDAYKHPAHWAAVVLTGDWQ